MTRHANTLLILGALTLASCVPTGAEDTPSIDDWETSTWRGAITLALPGETAEDRSAVLTLHEADGETTGVLVYDMGELESLGHALTVRADGALVLGAPACSEGLASRCDGIAAAIGSPTLSMESRSLERTLGADKGALERLVVTRNDWRSAPHDGFRPQSSDWPPCLEVNDQDIRATGTWDGRVITSPALGWARDQVRGAHCTWTNEDGQSTSLTCSPRAYVDTFNDPDELTLSFEDASIDLDAQTMVARFAHGGRAVTFDGVLDSYVVASRARDSRQYRWRGRVLADGALQGSFTMNSWGSDPSWTHETLARCEEWME